MDCKDVETVTLVYGREEVIVDIYRKDKSSWGETEEGEKRNKKICGREKLKSSSFFEGGRFKSS